MIIDRPITSNDIIRDCINIGIHPGMILLVHSSLKSIGGWIVGGAEAVIIALQNVLGDEGTLIMPTQSPNLTDPETWMNPPVDPQWWDLVRESMPPYDPEFTLTSGMGIIPETFRKQSGVVRSAHPHVSFAAKGRLARNLMESHPLDYCLGENSPLARMVEAGAYVLLLGTDHDKNTTFHLAEYRASYRGKKHIESKAPIKGELNTEWRSFQDINFHSEDFHLLGNDFERNCHDSYKRGRIGQASCMLASQQDLVNYAVPWLEYNR
ncbi:aminoglycoside N(3)-acetyltransferase [Paenibacillus crassostreae]|uniref:Aminoglycoside N(3)-acetyltransferase n=1 Tax=Paenibacillus crassostreae TaxID=1763538 RepID=A0A167GPY6_9BACL|nr:AAC(3) family N-acetyltransferase [Paenibacillus crassostreae]AOZ91983.1 AAC(3) family N-acetyltransferase [Paenibacillus crassostreae]OAB77790.1 aminoglycoside 3-N-acetyltransferase [Paenibacillus crassostreae]